VTWSEKRQGNVDLNLEGGQQNAHWHNVFIYLVCFFDWQRDRKASAVASVDCLIWQSFASVLIPGFTINRIVAVSRSITNRG
jgi:hypothetical protein